jgi:hypothetical protein
MPGVAGIANEIIKVPTIMTISVSCTPMFSRAFASQFSALKFSSGDLRMLGPNGFSTPEITTAISGPNGLTSSQSITVSASPTTIQTTRDTSLDNLQIG